MEVPAKATLPQGIPHIDAGENDISINRLLQINGGLTINGKSWLDYEHPVGSYYWSDDPTSPAQLWGGKWLQLRDVTLVAAGGAYAAGSEGGEISHKITVDELPAHRHTTYTKIYGAQGGYGHTEPTQICDNNDLQYGGAIAQPSESTGGSQAMSLMQPYHAAYGWRRMPDDWRG